jgi:serine/threonine protein kinase
VNYIARVGIRGEEPFRVKTTLSENGRVIKLSGAIDESLDPGALDAQGAYAVMVDLDGVHRITSYGVRQWTRGVSALKADYVGFVNCHPAVLAQFNMVAGFAGPGELISFYAPFACGACGKEFEILIDLRREYTRVRSLSLGPMRCPACGEPAELDDLPDAYLAYVASKPQPQPPPLFSQSDEPATASASLRVQKHIEGDVTLLWLVGMLDKAVRLKRMGDGLEGPVVVIGDAVFMVSPEGLEQLKALLQTEGPTFYLARTSPALTSEFSRNPSLLGRALWLSIRLQSQCTKCNDRRTHDVKLFELTSVQQGHPLQGTCGLCGSALCVPLTSGLANALVGVTLVDPPADVSAVLERHLAIPSTSDGPGRPVPLGASEAAKPMLFGRYQLLRVLGTGGMAEVFLARQTSMGGFEKNIVVKRILPQMAVDEEFIKMFFQEARLAARVSHPNVVQVHDLGQVAGRYYMAMEYVRGLDLNTIIKLCKGLAILPPLPVCLRVLSDVCSGLQAAHTCTGADGESLGIVHRDVSPHNILVSFDGMAKITDFGIAKGADTGSKTPTRTLKGKATYMAPEQIRPSLGPVDGRADVFAAGIVLYQFVTLISVFRRDSELATLEAVLNDAVPSIRGQLPDAPEELDRILQKAMARDLTQRYPTALAFEQDLGRLIAASHAPVTPADLSQWLRDLVRRGHASGQLSEDVTYTPTTAGPTREQDATVRAVFPDDSGSRPKR